MSEPFSDSRRLTGANLYFDVAGAALETARGLAFDEAALQRWRDNIARARTALGWPQAAITIRRHASGASLAFGAPIDQLYTATEVNEWAWYTALGLHADGTPVDDTDPPRPHAAHWDDDVALSTLRALAEAEARPALIALLEAADAHGVPAHADDDAVSIGEGASSHTWLIDALPAPDDVAWSQLHAIPKAVVTGSNGKTTTVRLLAALLRAQGLRSGYSSTDGLFVDGQCIDAGDYSGPVGARTVLREPRTQAAVLESARGGLLRRGLVAREARVAVVTNISADHFGEYGIHDLDDIAAVKLVVAKSLAADGLLVLNADDPLLVHHAATLSPPRTLAWFALELETARVRGGLACGVRDGRLVLLDSDAAHDLGAVNDMPLTFGGSARYNIANIAGAVLAAHALRIPVPVISEMLATFGGRPSDNPGRLQRWRRDDVEVLLDYAHNPDGLRGLLDVAQRLRRPGGRVALLLGQAGNREDADIRALAGVAAAAKPDRVWLKDIGGDYLRGRTSGAVPHLLRDALREAGMADDALPVCLDEAEAACAALAWARADDLLVLPVHEPERRSAVVAMLDRLQAGGWRAGQALPG